MPSLGKGLPHGLAYNAVWISYTAECLRRAKSMGYQKHDTDILVTKVREQFKKRMHETDPEKIQRMKDDAAWRIIKKT